MSSMKDIKQRISNISSAEQIIRAMDMIASTKLVKARSQLEGVRPIYFELKQIIEELCSREDAKKHIFFENRKVNNSLYIVITGDSGLSGSYNASINKKALDHMNQGKNEKILVVGSKGNEYFNKNNKNIIRTVVNLSDSQMYYSTESLAKSILSIYLSGEADEVFIAYTRFHSALNYIPTVEKILPIETKTTVISDYNDKKYEPDINIFIEKTIPLYLHMCLFRAFSESLTSENAARMISMDAAGKNASEIIEDLTRLYNRKRQTAITQELSEIIGSTSVLNKGGKK